jgi:glycoside/pentoside/hexuronide:cation symporter, GPH family
MVKLAQKTEHGFMFKNAIGHRHAAQFGVASIGTVIFIIAPQILLLYFLTAVLHVPPGWAGLALLIPKLIEFVFDIGVGVWSDRLRSAMGRRLPFMLLGAVLFPLAFGALFAPPLFEDWRMSLGWVMASSLVATLAYTVFSIPYVTMVGEMSDQPVDRLRVTAWRMAFVSIGVLIAGGVAPAIVEAEGGGRAGYAAMGIALAVCAGAASLVCLPAAWRFRSPHTSPSRSAPSVLLSAVMASPAYMRLWLSYSLQMAAVSVNAALLPFAVIHQLRASETMVSEIFVAMTIATLAAMPLSVQIARRIGPVSALGASLAISALGTLAMTAAAPQLIFVVIGAAFIFGAGQAGATSLPFALLPEASATGDAGIAADNAGFFTALWVAGEKLGLALGGALAGALLALSGFQSGAQLQSSAAIAAIPWLFGGVPTLLLLAAIIPLAALRSSTLNRKALA